MKSNRPGADRFGSPIARVVADHDRVGDAKPAFADGGLFADVDPWTCSSSQLGTDGGMIGRYRGHPSAGRVGK